MTGGKIYLYLGSCDGGGQEVSVLTYYSVDSCSNPQSTVLILQIVWKNKINKKEFEMPH